MGDLFLKFDQLNVVSIYYMIQIKKSSNISLSQFFTLFIKTMFE